MLAQALDKIIELAKQLVLFALVVVALGLMGVFVDSIFPHTVLTSIFVIIRRLAMILDFGLDIPLLLQLFGWSLGFSVVYGLFRAYMSVTKFFNQK
jgi:hypothetical protein